MLLPGVSICLAGAALVVYTGQLLHEAVADKSDKYCIILGWQVYKLCTSNTESMA